MRISDWSSDVCSSDLNKPARRDKPPGSTDPRTPPRRAGSPSATQHFVTHGRRTIRHAPNADPKIDREPRRRKDRPRPHNLYTMYKNKNRRRRPSTTRDEPDRKSTRLNSSH